MKTKNEQKKTNHKKHSLKTILLLIAVFTVISLTACSTAGVVNPGVSGGVVFSSTQTTESAETPTESAEAPAESATQEATEAPTDVPTEAPTEATTDSREDSSTEEPTKTISSGSSSVTGTLTITTEDGTVSVEGSTYTITSAGTYLVSGTLADGQIIIDAGAEDEVELDLSGVSISCSYDSPILARSAGKLKIKAMEGTVNSVSDTRALQTNENDTTGKAAIYALCDLNLVGTGTLTVNASYNNGIHTKDDLKIKNLTLTVTAPNNAIKGNDSVTIESGTITLTSTRGDAIKTENSDVSEKGNQRGIITISGGTVNIKAATDGMDAAYSVLISGGTITVNAGDDGIHSEGLLQIDGGYVDIVNSHEGLEGHNITINDGEIHVYATDDGVNATSSGGRNSDGLITVNGGKLIVEVAGRDVDGIDANGSYKQTGGFVVVSNPNADSSGNMSAVDADGSVTVTGGIIIALGTVPGGSGGGGGGWGRYGMGGMSSGSSLPSGYVTISGTLAAGTHTFTYGNTTETFTLKSRVSSGWIWASGISSGNYTLS